MRYLKTVLKNMFFLTQLKGFKAFHKYNLNKTVFFAVSLINENLKNFW